MGFISATLLCHEWELILFASFEKLFFFSVSLFLSIYPKQDFIIEMQEGSFFVKNGRVCRQFNVMFVFFFSAHKIRCSEENLTE